MSEQPSVSTERIVVFSDNTISAVFLWINKQRYKLTVQEARDLAARLKEKANDADRGTKQ